MHKDKKKKKEGGDGGGEEKEIYTVTVTKKSGKIVQRRKIRNNIEICNKNKKQTHFH